MTKERIKLKLMFVFTPSLLIKTEQVAKTINGIEVNKLPSNVFKLKTTRISLRTGLTAVSGERKPPATKITTITLRIVKPIFFFLSIKSHYYKRKFLSDCKGTDVVFIRFANNNI